jgi:hypothetical protein
MRTRRHSANETTNQLVQAINLTALASLHPLVHTIPAWMIGYWMLNSFVTRLLNTLVAISGGLSDVNKGSDATAQRSNRRSEHIITLVNNERDS